MVPHVSAPQPQSTTINASPSWLASIAVMLLFVAPLAPTLHLAGSKHHLCEEHGAIEHGDGHIADAPHNARIDVAVDNTSAEIAAGDDEHEHCDAAGLLKEATHTAPTTAPVAQLAASTEVTPVHTRVVRAGPPLLDLAPKGSPPASA